MKVNEFLNYCQARNLSERTISLYRASVKDLYVYLEGAHDLDEVTPTELADYVCQLSERVKPQSVNQYLVGIRCYFDYLCRFQGARQNPVLSIAKIKVSHPLPRYISQDRMEKLLSSMPNGSFKEIRSRAIVAFFYMTGARCSEVATLSYADLDFSAHRVLLYGKGRKERFVPLCQKLIDILNDYLSAREALPRTNCESLFCTISGSPLSSVQIRKIVSRALVSIVPLVMAHPHILRHTFATVLLNHGKPIEHISKWLGHTSIAVTQRYLTIAENPIINNFETVF